MSERVPKNSGTVITNGDVSTESAAFIGATEIARETSNTVVVVEITAGGDSDRSTSIYSVPIGSQG